VIEREPFVGSESARRRIILLGASNLTRGISTIVEVARNLWGEPLEILTALGFGRSYGMESSMLGRRLPGILQSELWNVLAADSKRPTAALVTDIGNDILYGVEPAQIAEWVGIVLDRLQEAGARVAMTRLPLTGISQLGSARFRLFRTLFFPACRLTLKDVVERAHNLDERLVRMASERSICLNPQNINWYGFDPIHIRLRHWRSAWPELLSSWSNNGSANPMIRGSLVRWLYLESRRPHFRTLFGVEQRRVQPAARLRDGTLISFY
jgi:hypothetical protein